MYTKQAQSKQQTLTEDDKLEIVKHISANHEKYYGRLTGEIGLAKQKQFWEALAKEYSQCKVNSGPHLKELVRNWIKRANSQYEKTSGRTGASGDEHLTELQTECRLLQRLTKGNEYMDGISAPQSSGTNKTITSTPKIDRVKLPEKQKSTSTSASASTSTSTASTSFTTPSNVHIQSSFEDSGSSNLKLPKPKHSFAPTCSVSGDEMPSNVNKNQLMQSFCENQLKDNELNRQKLELEKNRLDFEREKWAFEKKLIEQSIEEKKHKGMFYYLKCRELFRSPNISSEEIKSAHDLFQVPIQIEFEEVQANEDELSFVESVVSSTDNNEKDKDYDPNE